MAVLGRDAILGADDLKRELVPCPEWGGEVWVRCLTAKERDGYEASLMTIRGKSQEVNLQNARAKLAVLAICDEEGKRLFTDADLSALAGKSAVPLARIFETARKLSGITEDDVADLTKN